MDKKNLNILYEDAQILVCYKPAGIATQSKKIAAADMVSLLKNHIAASSPNSKNQEPYLSVIHRLDQPVEGIMVFAKTPFAAKELNTELTQHGFGKYYRAAVSKAPSKEEATLENYLVKDGRTNTSRICKKETSGAKLARLHYKIVPENERYFQEGIELDVHLDTGRHHQIRVQLAGMGCPIIGDVKYNPDASSAKRSGFQPLKLCSYRLEFTHPKTKKPMCFSLMDN